MGFGEFLAGCGKFEGSLREIGGSWPNTLTGILAFFQALEVLSHTGIRRVPASLIGEQRILPAGRRDQRPASGGAGQKEIQGLSPRTKTRTTTSPLSSVSASHGNSALLPLAYLMNTHQGG